MHINSDDDIVDILSMDLDISPSDMKRYIAVLETKVAKLADAVLPCHTSQA